MIAFGENTVRSRRKCSWKSALKFVGAMHEIFGNSIVPRSGSVTVRSENAAANQAWIPPWLLPVTATLFL